jgi:diadenosine tetraphosphate (Ap4A) HIT family hydrolase
MSILGVWGGMLEFTLSYHQLPSLKPCQVFYRSPTGLTLAIVNLKPLVPGHVLVIPRRPVARLADLTRAERVDLWRSTRTVQRLVRASKWGRGVQKASLVSPRLHW